MGAEIAGVLAQSGLRVTLVDISDTALDRARVAITHSARLRRMLVPAATHETLSDLQGRVTCSTDYESLASVDFAIENVTEQWDAKQLAWRALDRYVPEHCVMAANTSAISITRIASLTCRQERVLGIHFMNPVSLKPTVEVIRAFHTSDVALDTATELLTRLGKRYVLVADMPGFASNRVLMLTLNEAIWLVHDRVAAHADVDELFRSCFGHKMGPLETADLIGLDTVLLSLEALHDAFCDSKFRPCPLLRQMVDAGLHGRKTGRGFYTY
jgi:3-hydroxybutyryl-CoA dehydrogenase